MKPNVIALWISLVFCWMAYPAGGEMVQKPNFRCSNEKSSTNKEKAGAQSNHTIVSGKLDASIEKGPKVMPPPPDQRVILQGGETFEEAVAIGDIPYVDSGTTSGYTHDYDLSCISDDNSPDVVYSYTPGADCAINVLLCGSTFDTGLGIFMDNPFTEIACNDDFCDYQSAIFGVPLLAGHTYYFVVTGYDGDNGPYIFTVEGAIDCVVVCPDDATPEGEPDCYEDYLDNTNGGCGSDPVVFGSISDGETICGRSGTFLFTGLQYRDTDWYMISVSERSILMATAVGQFELLLMMLGGACNNTVVLDFDQVLACSTATASAEVDSGDYWIWVAPSEFSGVPCRSPYYVTAMLSEPPGCHYVIGDANDNDQFNGLDVTYAVAYFKGGPPPPYLCECPHGIGDSWYVAGDVNASCDFNGLDVTYMVAYFKGGTDCQPCPDCPPLDMDYPAPIIRPDGGN
jgi:hypothetical protein